MKLTTLTKLSCALGAALAIAAVSNADPLITGDIGFDGSASVNTGNLGTATTISSITGVTVEDGTQDGSYGTVPGGTATAFTTPISGFSMTSAPVSGALTSHALWSFTVGSTQYSFWASTIQISTQNANFLDLKGSGTAEITGYANTAGDWTLQLTSASGNSAARFSFGADTSIPSVPDSGMTALLIGLGMGGIGLGMIARRRSLTRS
ncbi:MAG TPA: hypothetical protein VHY22_06355 [Chthoniobacteraceae bacterium]|jgi:hypothetical protein|nr:hypothetical protein [Chthoniobacteraceae bacterium]